MCITSPLINFNTAHHISRSLVIITIIIINPINSLLEIQFWDFSRKGDQNSPRNGGGALKKFLDLELSLLGLESTSSHDHQLHSRMAVGIGPKAVRLRWFPPRNCPSLGKQPKNCSLYAIFLLFGRACEFPYE